MFHFLKLPRIIELFSLKLHSSVWIISVLPLCWLWSLPTCFWWENHRILKLWLPIVALKSPLNFGHALHVGHCLGPTHLEMRLQAKLKIKINAISNYKRTRLKTLLEPVCCKKQQKKVPDQLLVCGIGDLWRFWTV